MADPARYGLERRKAMTDTQLADAVTKRWCEVLEKDSAAAADDFFRSGGHSLLAVRLTNSLREDLGIRIPVSAVFEASTLENYVGVVSGLMAAA